MTEELSISKKLAEAAAFLVNFPINPKNVLDSAESAAIHLVNKWSISRRDAVVLLLAHFGHSVDLTLTREQAIEAVTRLAAPTDPSPHLFLRMEMLNDSLQETGSMLRVLGEAGVDLDPGSVKRVGSLIRILGAFALQSLDPCSD